MKNIVKKALIVCKEKTDLDTLRAHILSSTQEHEITEMKTAREALSYLQKLALAKVQIPDLIFLDTSCSIHESHKILSLLDKYYPKSSKKSVFLINRQFSLEKIMEIVSFNCVKDILTCPILKYELPSKFGRIKTLA